MCDLGTSGSMDRTLLSSRPVTSSVSTPTPTSRTSRSRVPSIPSSRVCSKLATRFPALGQEPPSGSPRPVIPSPVPTSAPPSLLSRTPRPTGTRSPALCSGRTLTVSFAYRDPAHRKRNTDFISSAFWYAAQDYNANPSFGVFDASGNALYAQNVSTMFSQSTLEHQC
jgi:hypothetical protein